MAIHDGHRQRMYEKLDQGGVLAEHEWLEVLLFSVLPRKNTNEIAHRLIEEFGSAGKVFFATPEQLSKVEGVGAAAAASIHAIGHFFAQYKDEPNVYYVGRYEHGAFSNFVKRQYAKLALEVADFYFLDGRGFVLQRHRFTIKKEDEVKFDPEDIAVILTEKRPVGVVLVHNHPSGCFAPSASDEELTKKCQLLCSMHNVAFCDHIICGDRGVYSYYMIGQMKEMGETYSVAGVLIREDERQGKK